MTHWAEVDPPVVEHRRTGDSRDRKRVRFGLPELLAGRRVDAVDVGHSIAEKGDVACSNAGLVTALRTPDSASKNQWTQPVFASSE